MKTLTTFLFFALFTLAACGDKEAMPTIEDQLQGAWKREWRPFPLVNTYNFHAGGCDTYALIPGQPVQYYAYSYTTDADTLTMFDLGRMEYYRFTVSFPTDTTAVLSPFEGVDYHLTRL